MYTENRQEIIHRISNYHQDGSITIKLITVNESEHVVLNVGKESIELDEPMVSELITTLEKAGVFLRQDPP